MGQKPLYKASLGPRLGPENLQVFFKNRGEILVLKKMLNILSSLVLLYVSGHFKQKKFFKIFQTDKKISSPNHLVFP